MQLVESHFAVHVMPQGHKLNLGKLCYESDTSKPAPRIFILGSLSLGLCSMIIAMQEGHLQCTRHTLLQALSPIPIPIV